MMVTEGLPVPCSTCYDHDAAPDDRPATSSSQPVAAGTNTSPSVAAITDALRRVDFTPHRSASVPASEQSRPRALLRSPTAVVPSGSAIDTPPASPDTQRRDVRRDGSFRKTYDEFVTKRAHPCDNCAMTLPRSDNEAPPEARGPTLRTKAPYAWVFGGGESSPESQPSSDTDEPEPEGDDAAPKLRRSATGSTTSRSSVFSGGPGSHTHFVEYISTKEPLLPTSFSIVRASCLRTLSFETLPRPQSNAAAAAAAAAPPPTSAPPLLAAPSSAAASGGPIFFGDPDAGYTTAYIFRVPDVHARGHRRIYAFLALTTHGERTAMKTFNLAAGAFRDLAAWITALAEAEAEKGAESPRGGAGQGLSEGSFLSGGAFARRGGAGMKVRQRGLAEVVGCPDFFIQLHIRFVRILRELGVKMNACRALFGCEEISARLIVENPA